jgi:hypothetical protein
MSSLINSPDETAALSIERAHTTLMVEILPWKCLGFYIKGARDFPK